MARDWRVGPEEERRRRARAARQGWEAKRRKARVRPADLELHRETGTVTESMRPFVAQGASEAEGLFQALGGPERVSEQETAILQDVVRCGVLMRALLARLLQHESLDMDAISKFTTLVNTRRQGLQVLGLNRRTVDAFDVEALARAHAEAAQRERAQDRAGETIDVDPDPEDLDEDDAQHAQEDAT